MNVLFQIAENAIEALVSDRDRDTEELIVDLEELEYKCQVTIEGLRDDLAMGTP